MKRSRTIQQNRTNSDEKDRQRITKLGCGLFQVGFETLQEKFI